MPLPNNPVAGDTWATDNRMHPTVTFEWDSNRIRPVVQLDGYIWTVQACRRVCNNRVDSTGYILSRNCGATIALLRRVDGSTLPWWHEDIREGQFIHAAHLCSIEWIESFWKWSIRVSRDHPWHGHITDILCAVDGMSGAYDTMRGFCIDRHDGYSYLHNYFNSSDKDLWAEHPVDEDTNCTFKNRAYAITCAKHAAELAQRVALELGYAVRGPRRTVITHPLEETPCPDSTPTSPCASPTNARDVVTAIATQAPAELLPI